MGLFLVYLACANSDKVSSDSQVPFVPIEWDKGLPALEDDSGSIRAIVHLHSHHSHDACDGDPQPNGVPDELCLADLRQALCDVRIDAAFLSDHPGHAQDVDEFSELFLIREGDTPLEVNGQLMANQINCDSGHQVVIFPGIESDAMMPLGITEHLEAGYDGSTEAIEATHDQGAAMWVAHTEQVEFDELVRLNLDGLELYQLHANLDPDIRADYLGLDSFGFLDAVQPFFFPTDSGDEPPHPDLAPLAFLLPNEPAIEKMERLGLQQAIGISAGTDAHQNVFPIDAPDDERIDSYRRMMRWFNTRIDVPQGSSPDVIRTALKAGQTWIAFESFGTPVGFSAQILQNGHQFDQGSELSLTTDTNLSIQLPSLSSQSPQSEQAPVIEGRLYHATENGRTLLHTWQAGDLEWPISEAGVYRIEIWIQPRQLTPYLGSQQHLSETWVPWIYSGGFFIR